jgi:hypothetical protein
MPGEECTLTLPSLLDMLCGQKLVETGLGAKYFLADKAIV